MEQNFEEELIEIRKNYNKKCEHERHGSGQSARGRNDCGG